MTPVQEPQAWGDKLLNELRRRRVFRVATLYVVALWPIIQIVDIASPALEISDAVMKYLLIAFFSGLPIALILAWIFDLNADGVAVTGNGEDGKQPLIGGRIEIMIVGALLVVVGGLFLVQLQLDAPAEEAIPEPVAAVDSKSIGVLPFASFSSNPADEVFADGLTEELLNVLVHVKSLRVAARTSSFAYKGVNRNVTEVGRELGVAFILEGSVRRNDVDDTVRVTAQLIETETGLHLWSETYDRQFVDIFKIQDDISNSVVDELQITLLGEERRKIQSRASANPEALVAYSMGQSELALRNEQSFNDAIRFFQRAVDLDPNYVDAHVGLATAHALKVSYKLSSREEQLPLAEAEIDKAFALDPESGNAWATLGLIEMQKGPMDENPKIREALEKALEYNPSHAMAHMWYASLTDSLDEKLARYRKAYELDPRSPVIGYNIANILMEQGHDREAMEVYGQIVESDPTYYGAYVIAAKVNLKRGRLDEAIRHFEEAYEYSRDLDTGVNLVSVYTDIGDFEASQAWLAKIKDSFLQGFVGYYDWLEYFSYAAVGRGVEAEHLLQHKVSLALNTPDGDDDLYENGAAAAYMLGDFDTTIALYERVRSELTLDHLEKGNRTNALTGAAHAYLERGMLDERDALLADLERMMLEAEQRTNGTPSFIWIRRAEVYLLKGEKQLAKYNFQRAIDDGWRQLWIINSSPIRRLIEDDEDFDVIIASLENRLEMMREQLTLASAFDSRVSEDKNDDSGA